MIETKLQEIERDIMRLEIDFNPKATIAFKIKNKKRLFDLREKRKLMIAKR